MGPHKFAGVDPRLVLGPTNGRAILPELFDGAENFPGIDVGDYDNSEG